MEIKNINNIARQLRTEEVRSDKTQSTDRSTRAAASASAGRSDQIQISDQARSALEIQRYADIAKKMPSVRPDAVAQAKERIASGFYDNNSDVLKKTAGNILDQTV